MDIPISCVDAVRVGELVVTRHHGRGAKGVWIRKGEGGPGVFIPIDDVEFIGDILQALAEEHGNG